MARSPKGKRPKGPSGSARETPGPGAPSSHPPKPSPRKQPWMRMRPEKIARAKKLLRDPNYPTDDVIHGMARVMASHFKKSPKRSRPKT